MKRKEREKENMRKKWLRKILEPRSQEVRASPASQGFREVIFALRFIWGHARRTSERGTTHSLGFYHKVAKVDCIKQKALMIGGYHSYLLYRQRQFAL